MSAPIVVMGATSGIGKLAVEESVRRDLPVRAFARSAEKIRATSLIEPVAGDALSSGDVTAALSGARAVIYALGIKERLSMLWEDETLFSESTKVLLRAMEATQTRRLVAVTGIGAGRSKGALSSVERLMQQAVLGKPYADKDCQEALIMDSDTDWTIVRPVILINGARTGRMQVLREPSTWRNGLISRADVAVYLVDAVQNDLDIRADVVIAR